LGKKLETPLLQLEVETVVLFNWWHGCFPMFQIDKQTPVNPNCPCFQKQSLSKDRLVATIEQNVTVNLAQKEGHSHFFLLSGTC